MDSNEKNLDMMTQEDIERLLAQQQNNSEKPGFEDADLASLLSELEDSDDNDLQEISDLLNRADNNEAVADDVLTLMAKQEAEGENAYDALDLFSGEQTEKKEGFFKRLINKFKKRKKDEQETVQERIEEVQGQSKQSQEESDDVMDVALAMLSGSNSAEPEADADSVTSKKEKKTKKAKKVKKTKAQASDEDAEGIEELDKKVKGKSAKKKTDKKVKGKPAKKKTNKKGKDKKKTASKSQSKMKSIREKSSNEDAAELWENDFQEMPNKKKIIVVFVAAIMIMLGFLVVNFYYTEYSNKKLAEEAYEAEDYLECYQLMYGQRLNDSQATMFHRSELILKMDIFWNHYNEYIAEQKQLEGLDELVQFVYGYPELSAYAAEWDCLDTVESTYQDVLGILTEDYEVSEQEVLDIAALKSDLVYTKALVELVEDKQKIDEIKQEYPDILPPEQERMEQGE